MAVSDGFKELLAELLAPVGPIAIRRMFGGVGVMLEGVMFALVADDVLYFKVDDRTRARFESEGMGPFTYATKNGENVLSSYYRAPERLYDEPDEMLAFAREAAEAALVKARLMPAKAGRRKSAPKTRPGARGARRVKNV
jgi:DNA transformation protein